MRSDLEICSEVCLVRDYYNSGVIGLWHVMIGIWVFLLLLL